MDGRNVPLCTDLLGDTSDLPRELSELVDHTIDDVLELYNNDTLHRNGDLLGQVSESHGVAHASNILYLGFEQTEFLDGAHSAFECSCRQRPGGHNEGRIVGRGSKDGGNLADGDGIADGPTAYRTGDRVDMRCGRCGDRGTVSPARLSIRSVDTIIICTIKGDRHG